MGTYEGKYRYVKGKYVEDTTKGKSVMSPRSYKSDVLVQVWLNSRKLDLLSRWLDKDGPTTRFLSEVVRQSLDAVVELLEDNGWEMRSTVESREMLERKYKANLNPRGKGEKNKLHNMILDGHIDDFGRNKSFRQVKELDVESKDVLMKQNKAAMHLSVHEGINVHELSPREYKEFMRYAAEDKVDEFVRILKGLSSDHVDQEQLRNSIEAARASGILYEEPKEDVSSEMESVVREGMTIEEVNARQEAKDDKLNQALKALAGRPKGDVGA